MPVHFLFAGFPDLHKIINFVLFHSLYRPYWLIMILVDLFQFRFRILIDLSRFRLEFQLMDERMIAYFINSRDKDKDILLFFMKKILYQCTL